MASDWLEDFERYPDVTSALAGPWAWLGGAFSISSANPGTGSKNLRMDPSVSNTSPVINSVGFARRVFGATRTTEGVGYRISLPQLPALDGTGTVNGQSAFYCAVFLDQSANIQLAFQIGTDGSLLCLSGVYLPGITGVPTIIDRSQPCFRAGGFQKLEFKVGVGSSGAYEARVNGVTRLNGTTNTNPSGAGEVSQILFGQPRNSLATIDTGVIDFDDMHAWNTSGQSPTDFVGNGAVVASALNGDTATADWSIVGGAGSGFASLGDGSDSTGIDAAAVNDKSAFTRAAMPGTVTGVISAQINFRAQKVGAGDCDVLPSFISGASEDTLSAQVMNTTPGWFWQGEAQDPATSAAWTVSALNAANVAFKRTL